MMKPTTFLALIIVILLLVIGVFILISHKSTTNEYTATSTSSTAEAILFPTNSDTLVLGQTYTLRWNEPSVGTTTQIFLIDTEAEKYGESVSSIDRVYGVPNTGSYTYTVPTRITPGTYVFSIGQLRSESFKIASTTK